jgi:hypothetical protein
MGRLLRMDLLSHVAAALLSFLGVMGFGVSILQEAPSPFKESAIREGRTHGLVQHSIAAGRAMKKRAEEFVSRPSLTDKSSLRSVTPVQCSPSKTSDTTVKTFFEGPSQGAAPAAKPKSRQQGWPLPPSLALGRGADLEASFTGEPLPFQKNLEGPQSHAGFEDTSYSMIAEPPSPMEPMGNVTPVPLTFAPKEEISGISPAAELSNPLVLPEVASVTFIQNEVVCVVYEVFQRILPEYIQTLPKKNIRTWFKSSSTEPLKMRPLPPRKKTALDLFIEAYEKEEAEKCQELWVYMPDAERAFITWEEWEEIPENSYRRQILEAANALQSRGPTWEALDAACALDLIQVLEQKKAELALGFQKSLPVESSALVEAAPSLAQNSEQPIQQRALQPPIADLEDLTGSSEFTEKCQVPQEQKAGGRPLSKQHRGAFLASIESGQVLKKTGQDPQQHIGSRALSVHSILKKGIQEAVKQKDSGRTLQAMQTTEDLSQRKRTLKTCESSTEIEAEIKRLKKSGELAALALQDEVRLTLFSRRLVLKEEEITPTKPETPVKQTVQEKAEKEAETKQIAAEKREKAKKQSERVLAARKAEGILGGRGAPTPDQIKQNRGFNTTLLERVRGKKESSPLQDKENASPNTGEWDSSPAPVKGKTKAFTFQNANQENVLPNPFLIKG